MQRACGNVINEAVFSFTEMLSPSSHVQKDNSEEDSSGSDAGLEPETDRFGFIVTGRSTAGWDACYTDEFRRIIITSQTAQRCHVKLKTSLI